MSKTSIASEKCERALLSEARAIDPNENTVHISLLWFSSRVGIVAPPQRSHVGRYDGLAWQQNQHWFCVKSGACCAIVEISWGKLLGRK
jgi:hypothetical protein